MESHRQYGNPLCDVTVEVSFTSAGGKCHVVEAFWNGGGKWLVRFSPDEPGRWRWRSKCTAGEDGGLDGQEGSFRCIAYEGDNPLYLRGAIGLSENRRYFIHADGTPFLWLGDTAWNGVLRARPDDWNRYLRTRLRQGFNVVQFVSTHWRGHVAKRPCGEASYTGDDPVAVSPRFFQRLDAKVASINEHGLLAAPIILWAFDELDPGQALSRENAVRLARYVVARWGAYQVAWLLGGDGNYEGARAERWRYIGREVFSRRHDRLVTMHPRGQSWVADEFRDQQWFDFVGYQSGHGDCDEHLRWLAMGPPATEWLKHPPRPVVNLEPNYEAHPAYQSKRPFDDADVRRAAFWSLLNAPPAGFTYGHNHIWPWADHASVPQGHPNVGTVQPWHEALEAPGAENIAVVRKFFHSLQWWRLHPAQELLACQPGVKDVRWFIAAAATEAGDLAVAYLPNGGEISLRVEGLLRPATAKWFDPRRGTWRNAGTIRQKQTAHKLTAPDKRDWVLDIRAGRR